MPQSKKNQIMIACSQQINGVPEVIKLIPLGLVKSQKGDFVVDEESYHEMCKDFTERGLDIVIDYEHQTLKDVQAPAGGWITELILADNAISGRVEWTPRAAEYLKNREYRYLSPVILVRPTDRKALRLKSVALTNVPAIDGMFPIINSENFNDGDDLMDLLKQLAALLGLGDDAAEADVLAAIQKLADEVKTLKETPPKQEEVVANKTILSLLSLKDGSSTADVASEIAKLQNLCSQTAQKFHEQDCAGLVEKALKDGKISPAQKNWAKEYALSSKTGFEEFLSKAAPVVPLGSLGIPNKAVSETKNEFDPVVCKAMGLSAEDIAKYGKGEE